MKTADIINAHRLVASRRLDVIARAYSLFIHRRTTMSLFRLTAEQRAEEIASAQANPITAGNLEFESWRQQMLNDRDLLCPDGEYHQNGPMDFDTTGYYWHCHRCGHNSDTPF